MPEAIEIESIDLCSIFSNLLNNAVHAAQKTENPTISLNASYSNSELNVEISNTTLEKDIEYRDPKFHGYGLLILNDLAKKYHGSFSTQKKDGIFYPDIKMPEQKEIGKWGLLHLGWLKHFRIARYNELLMSGELNEYLYKVNEEAQERFESLIVDLAESHGLNEDLKAKDQMKWVQLANYVANAAKEIVESEVIFRREPFLKNCFAAISAPTPIAEVVKGNKTIDGVYSRSPR